MHPILADQSGGAKKPVAKKVDDGRESYVIDTRSSVSLAPARLAR